MDRSGGYSEEENVQLKIYSDQDTHGMAARAKANAFLLDFMFFSSLSFLVTSYRISTRLPYTFKFRRSLSCLAADNSFDQIRSLIASTASSGFCPAALSTDT